MAVKTEYAHDEYILLIHFLYGCCQKQRSDTGNGDFNSMPSLHRAARGITLWEFLQLKVRQDSDRPNSTPQLAQMIGEFDALLQQLRSTVKDELVPVSTESGSTHQASKILVVSCIP